MPAPFSEEGTYSDKKAAHVHSARPCTCPHAGGACVLHSRCHGVVGDEFQRAAHQFFYLFVFRFLKKT